jgi:hypothetical protein
VVQKSVESVDRFVSLCRGGEKRFLFVDRCSLLFEYVSGTFPGQGSTIQTQHTLTYNALTGQVISDINSATVNSSTAPEGVDPARYIYAPDGSMVLREMGVFGSTSPSQDIYALTDPAGTVIAIAGATGAIDERYVFDGLGNGQALQASGAVYDPTTFTNPNRSANWQFQQQFSGSVFDPSTQLLQSAGTDYAWNIVYQGNMYNGIPGVYITPQGAFNPRQQSLLAPDLNAIQQGLSAYDPTGGEGGLDNFLAGHLQAMAFGASVVAGTAVSILTWGLATPWVAAALDVEATSLGIVGTAAVGAISGVAGGGASGFAYSAGMGASPLQIAESTVENGLFGGVSGGAFGAAGGWIGTLGYVNNAGNLVDSSTIAVENPLTGTALARQLGQEGEQAVGITGPKEGFTMPSGVTRFPDAFDKDTNVLDEVKNVQSLSYTQQLRDYAAFTQQNGGTFNLYVRPSTRMSGPLWDAINSKQIIINYIPGVK